MTVKLSAREEFAVITLARPDAMNALNMAVLDAFEAALREIESGMPRGVFVIGEGSRAFCGGADIKEMSVASHAERLHFVRRGQELFAKLEQLRMPSVALINGLALGGGLELALACTFRLAASTARLGLPEVKLGLIPGFGGTQRLPRLVGTTRAMQLIMSGSVVTADQALALGAVSAVSEGDLIDEGMVFARQFSHHSLKTLGLVRQAVTCSFELPLSEGLVLEAQLIGEAFTSNDGREGIAAFIEKRPAVFTDS